jgi:hypothetical protein
MCYFAQVEAAYKKFVRMFGALMSIKEFARLYIERERDAKIKIPKTMDAAFMNPQTDEERGILARIDAFNAQRRRSSSRSCSSSASARPMPNAVLRSS